MSPNDTSARPSSTLAVDRINYDIIFELCQHIPADDIVQFLSTCRTLYVYLKDEPIWRQYSSKHPIKDLNNFPGYTWYQVYTGLLHRYGLLLGLWANDHPFKGRIMDIRLSDREPYGIVGELWRFSEINSIPEDRFAMDRPSLPSFWEIFRVLLHPPGEPKLNASGRSRLVWYSHGEQAVYFDGTITKAASESITPTPTPALRHFSPTTQSTYVHIYVAFRDAPQVDNGYCHPEFPDVDSHPWYDKQRTPPSIPEEPSLVIKSSRKPNHVGRFMYTVSDGATKPWAISIVLPFESWGSADKDQPLHLHDPLIYWTDHRHADDSVDEDSNTGQDREIDPQKRIHPRYYPLRWVPPPPDDAPKPGEPEWTGELLEGLWLGAYSAHGTEVVYIEWDKTENEIRAHKVTGDGNVPRGAISWKFSLEPGSGTPPSIEDFGVEMPKCPVYKTVASISDHGYYPTGRRTMRAIAAVMSNNEIRLRWVDFLSTAVVRRYPGRTLGSEVLADSQDDGSGVLRFGEEW